MTAVNDAPVNNVPPLQNALTQYPLTFSEAAGNAIRISDPDAGDNPVQVTLSIEQGTLTLGNANGLASVTGNGSGTITIQDTLTNINAALDGMTSKPEAIFRERPISTSPPTTWATAASAGPKTTTDTVAIKTTFVTPPAIALPKLV